MSNEINNLYEFGDFRLDPETKLLFRDKELISIAPKVFETLFFLVSRPAVVHTKEKILDAVWNGAFVEESNLSQNIYVLRKTLGDGFIETVPKRGYRFIAPVTSLEKPAEEVAIVLERDQVEEVVRKGAKSPFKRVLAAAGIVGVLALIAFGFVYLSPGGGSKPIDAFTNIEMRMLVDSGAAIDPVISNDGQFVAFISRGGGKAEGIWLLDVETGSDVKLDLSDDYSPSYLRFSPNGKKIYFRDNSNGKKANIFSVSRFGGPAKNRRQRRLESFFDFT